MAEETGISWAHGTFNPWWGCVEVSPACDNCYARTLAHRWGFEVWGKAAPRRFFGEKHWNNPRRWNKRAGQEGVRRRIFCASMGDLFEARQDLDPWRAKLWKLIEETPNLDWLLLTKRPALMTQMTPWATWPANAWAGTTAEDQFWYDHRRPLLMKVPARIHWFSLEPLVGPIELGLDSMKGKKPDWMIVGGESGSLKEARPMRQEWAVSLREQCARHAIAYHFKQKGNHLAKELGCRDAKGGKPSEWPEELRVQEFPASVDAA